MKNILCLLGLHRWNYKMEWIPSIHAKIVTRFILHSWCERCNKTDDIVHNFDLITGVPINGRGRL